METLPWWLASLIWLAALAIAGAGIWFVHAFGLPGLLLAIAAVYALRGAWTIGSWLWG